jgi:hypothetical protein
METYAIQQLRRYGALLSIDPPKNDGEFKVKVMKKWITKDVMRMGRIVSVDMILVDQTMSFCFVYVVLILCLLLNIG